MPVLRHIYDSATGTFHDVEVTQEVYNFYRRNAWAIQRNNARFYAHEIQFSSLKGGLGDAFERFSEFLSCSSDPQQMLCDEAETLHIAAVFRQLPATDQHLLCCLLFDGCSERLYGKKMGLPQRTVNHRKCSALKRLSRHIQ